MTKNTGKPAYRLALLFLLPLLLLGNGARAAVNASVDRGDVALGDTLVLTLTASEDNANLQGVDTSHLAADFEVLSRNIRSSMTLINGVQTHKRELSLEITPRRSGTLTIPPFSIGSSRTQPIQVQVSERPQVDPGNEVVLFTAEADSNEVYVQGQLLLTLRIQQSVNLDREGISELELENAFVVPLEQKSYQRRMHGRLWLVREVRYAIFPEQSGDLTIPAQQFTGRLSAGQRGLFSPGNRGRVIRRNTEALTIDVLPKPLDYPAADWLPARSLQVEEEWSRDPETLRVGESVTRTVRISGEGLQGAQLPPTLFPEHPGLKLYPDQPQIDDREIASGLQGVRRDSVAIIPTETGSVTLPAIEIPWWDTATNSLRRAVIPARSLNVAAAPAGSSTEPGTAVDATTPPPVAGDASPATGGAALTWQLLALSCALGWAATLLLWWLRSRRRAPPGTGSNGYSEPESARAAYRNLIAACTSGAAPAARAAIIAWADALADEGRVVSLNEVKALFADAGLDAALETLEASLFGSAPGDWEGTELKAAVKRLHKAWPRSAATKPGEPDFALYPKA